MKRVAFYDGVYKIINLFNLMTSVLNCENEIFSGNYYVEVKDKRYSFHPTEIIIEGRRE